MSTSGSQRAMSASAVWAVGLAALASAVSSTPSGAFAQRDQGSELADETQLSTVLRIALEKNAALAEAGARSHAASERVSAAAQLPPLQFEYQLWAAPLERPYALDQAEMHMFGVKQTFPAFGSLGGQTRMATAEAKAAAADRRTMEQEIAARVQRAYAEYYRADRERLIRLDHVRLAQQVLDIARAAYQGGRGSQQDVLRAMVELSRLHNDLAALEGQWRSARGLLNALMSRPSDAPLGPPAQIDLAQTLARAESLERTSIVASERRPELEAATGAIQARENALESAKSSAAWPEVMVGLQYMYLPTSSEPHAYGAMLGVSLPWLSGGYDDKVRAARAALAAERSALSNVRNAAQYELYEATERLKAAHESLAIIDRDLLAQSQQSFESAQALYRSGQGDSLPLFDALRSLLEARIERERALALLATAIADVERAAGGSAREPAAAATKAP
jgi:cobalt-zinc-cadmium efflux system outer membrane protein